MTPINTTATIRGIGIDAVDIARFAHWKAYSDTKLSRIFSTEEIAYCRASHLKSAERFAARFAAREALYKALCQGYQDDKFFFLTLCKHTTITHGSHGQPHMMVDWKKIAKYTDTSPRILLSLTHTDTLAMAWVILEDVSVQKSF